MSRIRNRNTKPEVVVRSVLHRLGYRFTVNGPLNRKLPGRPDIVLRKHRTAVFVHGCFWHRHDGCRDTTTPKSRTDWWLAKFSGNVSRDIKNQEALRAAGWNVVVVWECDTQQTDRLPLRLDRAVRRVVQYEPPVSEKTLLKAAEEPASPYHSTPAKGAKLQRRNVQKR